MGKVKRKEITRNCRKFGICHNQMAARLNGSAAFSTSVQCIRFVYELLIFGNFSVDFVSKKILSLVGLPSTRSSYRAPALCHSANLIHFIDMYENLYPTPSPPTTTSTTSTTTDVLHIFVIELHRLSYIMILNGIHTIPFHSVVYILQSEAY